MSHAENAKDAENSEKREKLASTKAQRHKGTKVNGKGTKKSQ